ncbi:peptidase T [bacterium]|nr:peptidase T [bacterium]
MSKAIIDRLFRYVKMDTQSRDDSGEKYPSTEKQKELSKLLVKELKVLGLDSASMDEYGYVMATLASNLSSEDTAKVPTIGFLAHVDTSPDVSGLDVKPVIHANYQGGDIVLPGDTSQIIRENENPDLTTQIGKDIITSDGTTLLGADNKAGIAEIMTMIAYLQDHPEIRHANIKIAFTPDEEVGTGTKFFDVDKFGADYAYTVDGEQVGGIENETFNASAATFTIKGIVVHPGYAKNRLVNAVRIAADIVMALEEYPAPETTEGREGYIHPYVLNGSASEMKIKLLLRDFELEGIKQKSHYLRRIRDRIAAKYPKADISLEVQESYRNMRLKLQEKPEVVDYALEAVRRAGIEPVLNIIRGGTDGARLSYRGLLTPNIFTGGHSFHSKQEWISIQDMEKTVETLVNLVQIWVEKYS